MVNLLSFKDVETGMENMENCRNDQHIFSFKCGFCSVKSETVENPISRSKKSLENAKNSYK